jgi:hypothetical protein
VFYVARTVQFGMNLYNDQRNAQVYNLFICLILPSLGRRRRSWEDNIKMDLQEVGGGCEDWMELAQDRDRWRGIVSTVKNLRVQ